MTKTKRLYETNAYLARCEAVVLDVRELAGNENDERIHRIEVITDQTVFFPEGGGQSADIGWILPEDCNVDACIPSLEVTDVQSSLKTVMLTLVFRPLK